MFREPDVSREIRTATLFFEQLPKVPRIAVFASSKLPATDSFWPVAHHLGRLLSGAGCLVLAGGMEGLMGGVIAGANEACPGRGVPLYCRPEERAGKAGDGGFVFGHFSLRKQFFLDQANGVVFLPGGFGTLDELFFWQAFCQVEKETSVPAVFLEDPGSPFWGPLWESLTRSLVERKVVNRDSPAPVLVFSPEEALRALPVH